MNPGTSAAPNNTPASIYVYTDDYCARPIYAKEKEPTLTFTASICDNVKFKYYKNNREEIDKICVGLVKKIKRCNGILARYYLLFPEIWYNFRKKHTFKNKLTQKEAHQLMIDFSSRQKNMPDFISIKTKEDHMTDSYIDYVHFAITNNITSEFTTVKPFPYETLCCAISKFSDGFDISYIRFEWSTTGPIDIDRLNICGNVIYKDRKNDTTCSSPCCKRVILHIGREKDSKILSIMARECLKEGEKCKSADLNISMMESLAQE